MELLCPYRFDLIAKYLYIKYKEKNIEFYKKVYYEHIQTFNNCWEYPGTKKGIVDFHNSFDNLINNMKHNGYNSEHPILIDENGVLVNGSHRLMSCFYFNITPMFKTVEEKGNIDYNYNFFLSWLYLLFASMGEKYAS